MKVVFLAPANNYHTAKWCKYFKEQGYSVYVISFVHGNIDGVEVFSINAIANPRDSDLRKIGYIFTFFKVRKLIEDISPDFVSVHYASSYGFIAALSGIKHYTLSVWGSDVYDFPLKSILHKMIIKYSLYRATYILSTSKAMAVETEKYTDKHIDITPFGVDMDLFNAKKRKRKNEKTFVVGVVKSLEPKYGIKTLLEAISILKNEMPSQEIELRIAGKGSKADEYKEYAKKLGIENITSWLGFISQEQAACEYANMDCAIIPSESESFGVSAVEAQACSCPVIISEIPGLMEATNPGVTSLVVPRGDARGIAECVKRLMFDYDYRIELGKMGRKYVVKEYEYNRCFRTIENLIKRCKFYRKG